MSLIVAEIERLRTLLLPRDFASLSTLSGAEKGLWLEGEPLKAYFQKEPWLADLYESSDLFGKTAIASIVWINQADLIFADPDQISSGWNKWHSLIRSLSELEEFYQPIGGIIGYQWHLLNCLAIHLGQISGHNQEKITYQQPPRIDISTENAPLKEAIQAAAFNWSKICLIFPVGGAGDRLGLEDETGHPLPAAFLPFNGQSLLEGLIRDVEALELFIEQLTGVRHFTPIALMTSDEKENHQRIEQFLKESHHFGRPVQTLRLFSQKLVPVVTEFGSWASEGPLELMLKPGGHGAIWRAAQTSGVLNWLKELHCTHALVRQINNPLAASDYNLLALAGYGLTLGRAMGFLSCQRLIHASEGMNVWRLRESNGKGSSCITNVEYTDFVQEGISDVAEAPNSPYSAFGSNTNLFIIELSAIEEATRQHPFPGMILNLKSKSTLCVGHELSDVRVGRLESMMQNIADYLETPLASDGTPPEVSQLRQFLLFGERGKIISVTKNHPLTSGFANETPPSAFFDQQMMWRQLLSGSCSIHLPIASSPEEYFHRIPPFLLKLSPLLGPIHSWMARRLRGGTFSRGCSLDLNLCHLALQELYLDGALSIQAKDPRLGFVSLQQVTVVNEGWNEKSPKDLWKGQKDAIPEKRLDIVIEGAGGFIAQQVTFEGSRTITVRDQIVVVASYNAFGELQLTEHPLATYERPEALKQIDRLGRASFNLPLVN